LAMMFLRMVRGFVGPASSGRVPYILSRPGDSPAHPALWFDRSR
jgi:hypothetical protein